MPAEQPVGDRRPLPRLRSALRGTLVHREYRRIRSRRGAERERDALRSVETYCLFLGHARSGHSFLGALLDAHPQIVLADEHDPFDYLTSGFSREQLLWLPIDVARDQANRLRQKRGRSGRIYSYRVPDQWQGRYEDLRVIGSSNAGGTVRTLAADPSLIDRLRSTMRDIAVRFVHVARNPYDNIATMMLRSGRSFESATERYFENWRHIEDLVERIGPDSVHSVRHEDLIADPAPVLAAIIGFLGLEASSDYLRACAELVYGTPARSRASVEWSPEQRARIDAGIAQFSGLEGYSFDS